MKVNPRLALVGVACVVEVNWVALSNREWFPYEHAQGMLVLRPGKGPAADQSAEEGGGKGGSQSIKRLVHRAGYATRGMLLACAREAWRQYLANDVDYFMFRTLEERDEVRNPRQDIESAVSVGPLGVVEKAAESVPIH